MTKEKIKQIMKNSSITTDTSGRWISMEEMTKLTKAIVLECASIIDKANVENMPVNKYVSLLKESFKM
jgi:hypothetical protein